MAFSRCTALGTENGCYAIPTDKRDMRTDVGAIYAHGAGHLGDSIRKPDSTDKMSHVLRALVEAGFAIVSMDFGGANTWGSTTATGKMANALTQLAALGVDVTEFIGIGTSMGALTILNYAKDNAAKLACFVGIVPVVNRQHVHDSDLGGNGYQADINAAEVAAGTTYAATATSHDPASNTASMTFAQALYYGATDPIALGSDVTAYATACSSATATSMAGGHDSSVADPAAIVAFVRAHST